MTLHRFAPVVLLVIAGCGSSGSGGTAPVVAADASTGGGALGGSTGNGGSSSGGTANGGSSSGGSSSGGQGTGGDGAGGVGGVPADGSVSCDPRAVRCRVATPVCAGAMEVPSVVGSCYGPCVPITACKCASADECPDSNQYTCLMSSKHCTPYLQ